MISLICFFLLSLSADLRWVEVDVYLYQDGLADFIYKVRWNVLEGTMSGFYFVESTVDPHFDIKNSYAINDNGSKYPLEIKDLGNQYDIILADGQRFGTGGITYIFEYGGDLGQSGNLALTTSNFGNLIMLSWAPTQWDEPLEHYTVRVFYPIRVKGEEINPDDYGFRTEQFMNECYLLSYWGQEYEGKYWFTVQANRNNVRTMEKMQIQQYVPAKYFQTQKFSTIESENRKANIYATQGQFRFPFGLLWIVLFFLLIVILINTLLLIFIKKEAKMKDILKYGISVIVGIAIGYFGCLMIISGKNVEQNQVVQQHSKTAEVVTKEKPVGSNAIEEWIRFRNNEDSYKGTTVTWYFQVSYFTKECPLGYLDFPDYPVVVQGTHGCTYQAASVMGYLPKVREDDWLVVKGRLDYISADGVVVLEPIEINNEGYKPD